MELPTKNGLDPDTISYLKEISDDSNPDFFRDLVGIFLQQTPELIETLKAQIAELDFKGIEQVAHRLKGSSLNLGAKDLAELFSQLEEMGKNETAEGIKQKGEQLDSLFLIACESLKQEI